MAAAEGLDDWLSAFDFCNDLHFPADLDLSRFPDLDLDLAEFSPLDISFGSPSQHSPNASPPCPPTPVEHDASSFSSPPSVENVPAILSTIVSFPTSGFLDADVNLTSQEDATSPDSCNTGSSTGSASSDAETCIAIVSQAPEKVPSRRKHSFRLESKTQVETKSRVFDDKDELNPEDDKKQKRLLRNRELAHESRQRKKSYVRSLEAKCKLLEKERNDLQQHICLTSAENAVLREELSRLKKMKGDNGATEPAVLYKDSLPLEFLLLLLCQCLLVVWASLSVHPSLDSSPRTVLLLISSIKRVAGKLPNVKLHCRLKMRPSGHLFTYLKQIQFDDCG